MRSNGAHDRWILEANIARFRTLLEAEQDAGKRRVLATLLEQEERKLARLIAAGGTERVS